MNEPSQHLSSSSPSGMPGGVRIAGVLLIVAAIVATGAIAIRRNASAREDHAQRVTDASGGPLVRTATVVASPTTRALDVIGETHPFQTVTLYAKVSGYLKSIRVDKGDRVTKGQLLAVIEAPETDALVKAARAEADQKAVTARRVKQLLDRKIVSPQEADQADADAAVARERYASLAQQQEFENLRAPFDGVISARYADEGALVQSAASSQTSALPLVMVSDVSQLRIYAFLDQPDAAAIRVGLPATITLDEKPDLKLTAHVTRTGGELDLKTRKLLVELDVDNRNAALLAGSFVHVAFALPTPSQPQMPAEALVVRGGKSQVPVVGDDHVVHFRDVTVGYNDGKVMRVLHGLAVGDRVVLNVGDAIGEGAKVRIADAAAAAPAPGTAK